MIAPQSIEWLAIGDVAYRAYFAGMMQRCATGRSGFVRDRPEADRPNPGVYSKAVKNCMVLDLPPVDEVGPIELARLQELLSASIEVWTPDAAIATSMERMMQRGGGVPWTSKGWFNYERRSGIAQG